MFHSYNNYAHFLYYQRSFGNNLEYSSTPHIRVLPWLIQTHYMKFDLKYNAVEVHSVHTNFDAGN